MKLWELRDDLKEKAIANLTRQMMVFDDEMDLKHDGFYWDQSPEGFEYWQKINRGEFPPIELSLEDLMNQIREL